MKKAFTIVFIVFSIILLLYLLLVIPEWEIPYTKISPEQETRIKLVNETRGVWAQIFIGITGIILIYISWRRLTAIEKNLEEMTRKARALITEDGYFRPYPHLHNMDGFFSVPMKRTK